MVRELHRDRRGAAFVEFALLLPVIFGAFLGVLQVGLGMQAHNALRNISADASRYAVIEYQKENATSVDAIETKTCTIATSMPYALEPGRFEVDVIQPATQRVSGAVEFEIETRYSVRSVLPFFGISDIPISFTRPIFVLDSSTP